MPASEKEQAHVTNRFASKRNFPHCVGAMDGKHVQILAPEHSDSMYYNYKQTFIIVLLAVADTHHNVIYADTGCQGCISDGGAFKHSSFYTKIGTKQSTSTAS